MNELPPWPAKLTREQQKAVKQRGRDFDAALKGQSRGAGWRFAGGEVFRQTGDWFIGILPSLLWERGALVRMMVKPMTLDPLFWDIVGLSENEALPLSFRATGAWVLRPPSIEGHAGPNTTQVQQLATEVLDWCNQRTAEVLHSISIASMLAALPEEEHLRGQNLALAICLRIMMDDLEGAARLCRINAPATHPLIREAGGFTTHNSDGSICTFLDQARDWIALKRREGLRLA